MLAVQTLFLFFCVVFASYFGATNIIDITEIMGSNTKKPRRL